MTRNALEHIRVLDLSQFIAGPYCAKLLADYGAQVLKVEPPGGDPLRRLGPFYNDLPHPEGSGLFLYMNTNKRGITLNLETAAGASLFRDLVREADVLVEAFRPGTMERLGLGYDDLLALNPALIMTSITSFGQSGPYRDYEASDLTLYALGGLMAINGEQDREPLKSGGRQSFFHGGLHAALATLAAVFARRFTGQGQHIDLSIQESIASMVGETLPMYWTQKVIAPRQGNRRPSSHPTTILPCRNGYVAIQDADATQWPALVEMMGSTELAEDEFSDGRDRRRRADEVDALMAPWLMEHDKEEIARQGQERGMPFAPVSSPEDLLEDPQYRARRYFETIDHPHTGPLPYPSTPFRMSETPWKTGRAPLLGEHNEAVFCQEMGMPKTELARLREMGVV